MPKLKKDDKLHQDVQNYVQAVGGLPQAAQQLGVGRVTLWRFCKTGCALDRTRHSLSQGISRNKSATTESPTQETTTTQTPPRFVSDEDLKTMRLFCNGMMALIDMYEQLSLSRGATHTALLGERASASVVDTENNVVSGARG